MYYSLYCVVDGEAVGARANIVFHFLERGVEEFSSWKKIARSPPFPYTLQKTLSVTSHVRQNGEEKNRET